MHSCVSRGDQIAHPIAVFLRRSNKCVHSPLFDLGGLTSNNELSADREAWVLERYFGRRDEDLMHRFAAMKSASLLRETLWSMVSERVSKIDFDYTAYTAMNLERFTASYAASQGKA